MRARVLIRKLNFLRRLVGEREEKLSSQIFHIFAERDVSELEQCRYLEASYRTNCTGDILTSAESWSMKILSADKDFRAKCCNNHQSLKHLSTIHSEISWLKIWDIEVMQTRPFYAAILGGKSARVARLSAVFSQWHPVLRVLQAIGYAWQEHYKNWGA